MRNPIPPDDEVALRKAAAAKRRDNARLSRTCVRCGKTFDRLTDKLIHITVECPHRGEKRLRAVSCWACAKEIDINVTRTCECGFTLPEGDGSNPLPVWESLEKKGGL
jgi:hypothetical protein